MVLSYPPSYAVQPLTHPLQHVVRVPGSKSLTNRALVLAALAARNGPCTLTGALRSEDTTVMMDALRKLGFTIDADWNTNRVTVEPLPPGPLIPNRSADLFVANSGTTVRFLSAMLSLGSGRYRLDGIPRMRERPIQDLLVALQQLGVNAISEAGTGCPPIIVESNGWIGHDVVVAASTSSQFLSGLLMAAAYRNGDTRFDTQGPRVSEPYITMTVEQLRSWGHRVAVNDTWLVHGQPALAPPREYAIEPDASAASYFLAAAAIAGGRITVEGLRPDMLQGDVKFVEALAMMGCRVDTCEVGITVHGRPLRGIDIDMNAISDTVMSLAVVALFAEGQTRIRNVAHIRHKETDRLSAVATELRKFGAEVQEEPDGLIIHPRPLHGATVDTYNDHRMAMSLALVGLKVPGVVVNNPGCVAKTYPQFWHDFEALR